MPVPQFNDTIIISLVVGSTLIMIFFVVLKMREKR